MRSHISFLVQGQGLWLKACTPVLSLTFPLDWLSLQLILPERSLNGAVSERTTPCSDAEPPTTPTRRHSLTSAHPLPPAILRTRPMVVLARRPRSAYFLRVKPHF